MQAERKERRRGDWRDRVLSVSLGCAILRVFRIAHSNSMLRWSSVYFVAFKGSVEGIFR